MVQAGEVVTDPRLPVDAVDHRQHVGGDGGADHISGLLELAGAGALRRVAGPEKTSVRPPRRRCAARLVGGTRSGAALTQRLFLLEAFSCGARLSFARELLRSHQLRYSELWRQLPN